MQINWRADPEARDPDHRRAARRTLGLDVVRVVLLGDARARIHRS